MAKFRTDEFTKNNTIDTNERQPLNLRLSLIECSGEKQVWMSHILAFLISAETKHILIDPNTEVKIRQYLD